MSTYTVKKSTAIVSVGLLIAVAGTVGFFAAGFAKAGQASGGNLQGRNNGQMMQRTGTGTRSAAMGGMVSGELIKKDDGSLSLKTRDGSSKLVLITSSTKAFKMSEATMSDFSEGQNLMVIGKQNSDGSVTAQTVQLRPEGMADFQIGGGAPQKTTGSTDASNGNRQDKMQFGGPDMPPPPGM